jgi:hypothetical protein
MKRIIFGLTMAVVTCSIASAQATPMGAAIMPALTNVENQIMSLAKAMPADKYSFAPSQAIFVPSQKTDYTGVRTFGQLLIHVAQANYGFGATISSTAKPTIDPKTLATLTSKDEIIAALAASFEFEHAVFNSLTPETAFVANQRGQTPLSQAAGEVGHVGDEYGQLVEYARMNGVVPPASMPKK